MIYILNEIAKNCVSTERKVNKDLEHMLFVSFYINEKKTCHCC